MPGIISRGWIVVPLAMLWPTALTGLAAEDRERDLITQVSLINSLMLGRYDGVVPLADVLARGDIGLGTLDRLDGELIVLDGEAWNVNGEGVVQRVDAAATTPFAVVTPFEADGERSCPRVASLRDLDESVDAAVGHANNFVAVRIDGRCATLRVRSVRRQQRPYRELTVVAREQAEWSHADIEGTLIGFRSPAWAKGISVAGWHWHFLSADRTVGGHVLDVAIREGTLRHDVCGDWLVLVEQSQDFNAASVDRDFDREVEGVERQRRK